MVGGVAVAVHERVLPSGWQGRRGRLRAVAAPSGTVTFLFTDIEGSTGLWEAAPEAMRSALERHDAILRGAVDDFGGYVFATGGDGFAVAFARAADALARRRQPKRR